MRSIQYFMIIASFSVVGCSTMPEGLKKSTTTIDDANLIENTSNLVCRGDAIMPLDNEKIGITFVFEEPDRHGAKGIAKWSKGRDGDFDMCRLTTNKMSLICEASAGPVVIPMMIQFSSDMGQATGLFGSPFDDTKIQFKTDCTRKPPM